MTYSDTIVNTKGGYDFGIKRAILKFMQRQGTHL